MVHDVPSWFEPAIILGGGHLLLGWAMVRALRLGLGGPRYEHRLGVFSWPDVLWTAPLVVAVGLWVARACPVVLSISPGAKLALASLVLANLAAWPFNSRWLFIDRLAPTQREAVQYNVKRSRSRRLIRTLTWQGALLLVVHHLGWPVPLWAYVPAAAYALWFLPTIAGLAWSSRRWVTLARNPYHDPAQPWDLFISYRSLDAQTVRGVVDLLNASGLRVWFAEYNILISGRDGFQKLIDEGLRQSRHALAFTNDPYVRSGYCRLEMEQLLDPGWPGDRILEIRTPPDGLTDFRYERLLRDRNAARIDHAEGGDLGALLEFIGRETGLPVRTPRAEPLPPDWFRAEFTSGVTYALDLAGWEIASPGSGPGDGGDVVGPKFHRVYADGTLVGCNLHVGPDGSHQRTIIPGNTDDDRTVHDELLTFAWLHFSQTPYELRGVHLIRSRGYTHPAFTYWTGLLWHRRFSIVLPHPQTQTNIEFALVCQCRGSFADYCRHAVDMDRVALSIQWLAGGAGTCQDGC